MWDIEVDVACLGAGPATLASAVASADAGASVLLATPLADRASRGTGVAVRPRIAGFLGSWNRLDMDAETDRYLTDLAYGCSGPGDVSGAAGMTVRTATATPRSDVAFIGSRLGAWNSSCLGSPYGMLFSSVSGWHTQRMRTEEGQALEVMSVGSLSRSDLDGGLDATAWLQGQVGSRGIDEHRFTELERIVFDDGRIVGVELVTPDGLLAVGVRHGISMTSGQPSVDLPAVSADTGEDLQMFIVGQAASRFLRVELLSTTTQSRPMCGSSGRQLRYALRGTRSLHSGAGRCGKPR